MVTNYNHLTFLDIHITSRTTVLEIRLPFIARSIRFEQRQKPKRAAASQLRPALACVDGSDLGIRNKKLRPSVEGRRKDHPMTLDFNHYRDIAHAAEGNRPYSDAEILRLWGFVDHLTTRSIAQNCPHILTRENTANAAIRDAFALYSKDTREQETQT